MRLCLKNEMGGGEMLPALDERRDLCNLGRKIALLNHAGFVLVRALVGLCSHLLGEVATFDVTQRLKNALDWVLL